MLLFHDITLLLSKILIFVLHLFLFEMLSLVLYYFLSIICLEYIRVYLKKYFVSEIKCYTILLLYYFEIFIFTSKLWFLIECMIFWTLRYRVLKIRCYKLELLLLILCFFVFMVTRASGIHEKWFCGCYLYLWQYGHLCVIMILSAS